MVECPFCKDDSRYATDKFKPKCSITGRLVNESAFRYCCSSHRGHKECSAYKSKYK